MLRPEDPLYLYVFHTVKLMAFLLHNNAHTFITHFLWTLVQVYRYSWQLVQSQVNFKEIWAQATIKQARDKSVNEKETLKQSET